MRQSGCDHYAPRVLGKLYLITTYYLARTFSGQMYGIWPAFVLLRLGKAKKIFFAFGKLVGHVHEVNA